MNVVNTSMIAEVMALKKKRVSLLTAVVIGFFIPFLIACLSVCFTTWGQENLLFILGAWLGVALPLIITMNLIWRCPACKRKTRFRSHNKKMHDIFA